MLEELVRVRAYRANVPEPDQATVLAARAELLEAIRHEPQTAPQVVKPMARAFFRLLLRNNEVDGGRSRRLRRLQRRRRLVLAAGLAAIGVAVAGVLGFSTASSPPSALAAKMNQLAQIAANQDWAGIPGPGQYLYLPFEYYTPNANQGGHDCDISEVTEQQLWVASDGSGVIDSASKEAKFTSTADQARCAAAGITDPASQLSPSSRSRIGGGSPFPTNAKGWQALSTDPATLLKQVHQLDGGPNDDAERFVNVADFMRMSPPPAIRAALYRAAALIPGVELLGPRTDPLGRSGLAVAFPADNGNPGSTVLIFDQQTAALLAEEYHAPDGTLEDWTTYQPAQVVDSIPSYTAAPTQTTTTTPGG